ncbi:phage N-6-adenine-methyltransferase, partial [Aeromonas caviae]
TRDMTQTPLWLFRALDLEFNFALDAAALPETALCEKYLTPDIDALSVDWGDFISPSVRSPWAWLNPPYSDIGPWVEKAIEQQGRGIGTVMLVPQDTSTEWYPGMRASEVRHITGYHDANGKWRNGRVSFINKATGEEMKGNPKGSMLLIFAPNWRGECRIRDVSKLTLLLAGAEPISAAA